MRRLKVLIVAHEISPIQGSECAEGWNIVTKLAKFHDVTVLFASGSQFKNNSYKIAIDDYLSKNDLVGVKFISIDQPKITKIIAFSNRLFKKLGGIGLPLLYFMGYKFWQRKAYIKAKKIHKKVNFDIVHQLTQITFREPGYTWKLNAPFVWGPTGGTSTLPAEYKRSLTKVPRLLEEIRTISNNYQSKYVSRIKKATKKASLIYVFSKEDATFFKKKAICPIKFMLDAGSHVRKEFDNVSKNESKKIKGLWVGRLMERKAPLILLKTLSLIQLRNIDIEFTIIGKGPLEKEIENSIFKLKLTNVKWIKQVSHQEVINHMNEADFFVHTSIREATSNVIPEALSTGLPIICHDVNGMSIAINEDCGIKIPLISPEISIDGFSDAICKLATNNTYLSKLKKGALKRANEISWDNMAETIAKDYLSILKIP